MKSAQASEPGVAIRQSGSDAAGYGGVSPLLLRASECSFNPRYLFSRRERLLWGNKLEAGLGTQSLKSTHYRFSKMARRTLRCGLPCPSGAARPLASPARTLPVPWLPASPPPHASRETCSRNPRNHAKPRQTTLSIRQIHRLAPLSLSSVCLLFLPLGSDGSFHPFAQFFTKKRPTFHKLHHFAEPIPSAKKWARSGSDSRIPHQNTLAPAAVSRLYASNQNH